MALIITILPVVTKDLPISSRFTPYNFFIAMQVQQSYNPSTNGEKEYPNVNYAIEPSNSSGRAASTTRPTWMTVSSLSDVGSF